MTDEPGLFNPDVPQPKPVEDKTSKKMLAKQRAVLDVMARIGPSTDIELIDAYDHHARERRLPLQSGKSVLARRDELRRQGLVRDTGLKRPSPTGRRVSVWVAVDKTGDPIMEPFNPA